MLSVIHMAQNCQSFNTCFRHCNVIEKVQVNNIDKGIIHIVDSLIVWVCSQNTL